MAMTDCKVTENFFLSDEFCETFYAEIKKFALGNERSF